VGGLPYAGLHGGEEQQLTLQEFVDQVMSSSPGTDRRAIFNPIKVDHPMATDVLTSGNGLGGPGVQPKYFDWAAIMNESSGGRTPAVRPGVFEFYFGPALSGAQPHRHASTWNALLRGKKRWFLWPAGCRNTGWRHGVAVWEWVKTELPRLRGKGCSPLEFYQHANEVLFIPYGWYHAVLNVEPVIGK